jgi:drug/metabolite transporter (DMT)-like permease
MHFSSRSSYLGIALMATTWSIYAIMSALAKYTYQFAPPTVSFFFQNFIAALVITPFLLRGGWSALKSKQPLRLFWRGIGGAASFYCFFKALETLPLTDCTVLNCTSPLFVPLILFAVWKRTSSWQVWVSLLLGFSGTLFVFPPQSQSFNESTLIGLLGGLGTALVMFILRSLANEPYLRVMFYYFLIGSIVSFPFALAHFGSLPAFTLPIYILIGALFALAQVAYTLSLRMVCPSISAPFCYIFILASVLIDCIVWQRLPSLQNCIGIALVIAGGGLVLVKLNRKEPVGKIAE